VFLFFEKYLLGEILCFWLIVPIVLGHDEGTLAGP
jgi:hypothetical protein